MKRLFVPLKSEPFYWFKEGKKKYELRNQIGQYNDKQLITGRKVELRRGYSTNDKLFGYIGKVIKCDTIDEVCNSINYKKINPTVNSLYEFKKSVLTMLKENKKYVIIEINLIN